MNVSGINNKPLFEIFCQASVELTRVYVGKGSYVVRGPGFYVGNCMRLSLV